MQKEYINGESVETVYIGGGTPSLLDSPDLQALLLQIRRYYTISEGAEITLEANPDDITSQLLTDWVKAGINRLSIGIQSFFDEDLRWMNRAHTAQQASENLLLAKKHFKNITADLIYGFPLLTDVKWKQNAEKLISLQVPHLSCYALTVEPKTPLHKMITLRKTEGVNQEQQSEQFLQLMDWMQSAGYDHYEISNFARPGYRSRHNTSYWQGKKYLGIGPSAHSFDGVSRQWNISNNRTYITSINSGTLPAEKEILTPVQKTNEYIMTSLRTAEGLDLSKLEKSFRQILNTASYRYIEKGQMINRDDKLILTKTGKLFADGIAADLFFEAPQSPRN